MCLLLSTVTLWVVMFVLLKGFVYFLFVCIFWVSSSCVHSLTYVCVGCSFPHGKLKALQVPQLELGENYCLGFFPTWWPYILTVNIFNTRNKYCNTSLNFLFLLQPHARIVSVVTLIWALLSTLLIVLTCIFYSDAKPRKNQKQS